MLTVLIFCLNVIFVFVVRGEETCDYKGVALYQDLGCTPILRTGEECPVEYICDDFTRNSHNCLFRTKSIDVGKFARRYMLSGTCFLDCSCDLSGKDGLANFNCAKKSCPELNKPLDYGCYWKYDLNSCCPVEKICRTSQNSWSEGKICEVDGRLLAEGQLFTPSGTCLHCSCGANFTGVYEHPFCRRPNCAVQVTHGKELARNCAPVYLNSPAGVFCCPDTFVCPSQGDYIMQIHHPRAIDFNLRCQYGRQQLLIGEGFYKEITHGRTTHRIVCECSLPPLLTCKTY